PSSTNSTVGCGKPRLYASLPVAMNSSLRVAFRNESSSANSHSAKYACFGSPIGAPVTLPCRKTAFGTCLQSSTCSAYESPFGSSSYRTTTRYIASFRSLQEGDYSVWQETSFTT